MTTPLPITDIPWNIFGNKELTNSQTWFSRIFAFLNGLRDTGLPYQSYWKATATVATSMPTATWTRMALNQIEVDSDSVGISNGGYLTHSAGIYMCIGSVGCTVTTGSRKGAQVMVNPPATGGTGTIEGSQKLITPPAVGEGILSGMTFVTLATSDRLNICGYQETGGTVNSVESTVSLRSSLTVVRVA